MSKATVDDLDELHGLVCKWGISKLLEEEHVTVMTLEGPVATGATRKAAKASDVAAITKFLADNKIAADAGMNHGLHALEDELKKRRKYSDRSSLPPNVLPMADAAASQMKGLKYGN